MTKLNKKDNRTEIRVILTLSNVTSVIRQKHDVDTPNLLL